MLKNKPEVLAPCGNKQSLLAAIAAGADACYLAGNSFGARAFAGNFSDEGLIEAIEYAHLHGVKIYLTVNTLVKDNEIERVFELLKPLYETGLDSVLVQDFGVMKLIREAFPGLPIHTSTQMNILTAEGALLAKSRGASRIVAAREMTIQELSRIRKEADIEVEAFVHGAMCVCYSGRCLMSSMAGGRSGNRGCCAQPCRRMYRSVFDSESINNNSSIYKKSNNSYSLSMKDMCTIRFIPELIDAGIDSLKIEGRMKNEYYVAATVDSYKRMVEAYIKGEYSEDMAFREEKRLLDIFNRGGFTSGYIVLDRNLRSVERQNHLIDDTKPGRRGVFLGKVSAVKKGRIFFRCMEDIGKGDEIQIDSSEPVSITSGDFIKKNTEASLAAPNTRMIKPGTGIYRTRNKKLTEEIDMILQNGNPVDVNIDCDIKVGKNLSLRVSLADNPDIYYLCEGAEVQVASTSPVDEDTVRDKLVKTGDPEFSIVNSVINMDDDVFVPASALKKIRREGIEGLRRRIISESARSIDSVVEINTVHENESDRVYKNELKEDSILNIAVTNKDQLREALNTNPEFIWLDIGLNGFSYKDINETIEFIRNSSVATIDSANNKSGIIIMLPYVDRYTEKTGKLINDILVGDREAPGNVDGFYIRCYDDLALIVRMLNNKKCKYKIILAHSIYAYNSMAVRELLDCLKDSGAEISFESPMELSGTNADAIYYPKDVNVIRLVYGKPELMITDALSSEERQLQGESGKDYRVYYSKDYKYSLITDAKPVSLHNVDLNCKSLLYRFTDEKNDEIYDIIKNRLDKTDFKYSIGHYEKGI